jgi:hypothetical protein
MKEKDNLSRFETIRQLRKLNAYDSKTMNSFSDQVLREILTIFQKNIAATTSKKIRQSTTTTTTTTEQQNREDKTYDLFRAIRRTVQLPQSSSALSSSLPYPKLSSTDKKILLQLILNPNSKLLTSPSSISKILGIPIATVKRHRNKVEDNFLNKKYILQYWKFGLRKTILSIYINKGWTASIGCQILAQKEVISVERIVSKDMATIKAEAVFRNNMQLLDTINRIKSIPGVDSVSWLEVIEILQINPNAYQICLA